MPIIVKKPNADQLEEYLMLELQGDLQSRYDDMKDMSESFVGDLLFNKFGHPILIIGHHILFGTEKTLEKPFAVLEKVGKSSHLDKTIPDSQPNTSILDNTVSIENRTEPEVEYLVKALITKKYVFTQRPRPIINCNS